MNSNQNQKQRNLAFEDFPARARVRNSSEYVMNEWQLMDGNERNEWQLMDGSERNEWQLMDGNERTGWNGT